MDLDGLRGMVSPGLMRQTPPDRTEKIKMAFFKEEDTHRAEDEVKAWKLLYPEAAKQLQELWKRNVPTAGHKTMAREVVK